ncbi:MAG TPA: AAA family ATPase [Gammaproteobacteria bacterium]|nr:AAA family ATPase [Gammaproteobacteria bacterium]
MYDAWFGLREKPFSITPDPRYLYLSARHAEALAHLLYGITESGGFIQLTGEVGTGKTTLTRTLLEQLPQDVDVALVLNPRLTIVEFLRVICDELGVAHGPDGTAKDLIDALNRHLLDAHARGRRVILIVDEAQNLSPDLLEQIRLLTNLETPQHKLLQIILIGQPELRQTLARADMRQLAQRITGRYHLTPLTRAEMAEYVRHRLRVAGAEGPIFTPAALRVVYGASKGVPRLVNVICDRALLGAYTRELRQVNATLARRAAREVLGETLPAHRFRRWWFAAALVAAAGVAAFAWETVRHSSPPPVAAARTAAPVTLAALFADPAWPADTDTAFRTLFALWHQSYWGPSAGAACAQAAELGLRCYYQRGNWNTLRALDRPAIITLEDATGGERHVVVTGLGMHDVTLAFGERRVRIPLAEVDAHWYGEFLILWQPPFAFEHALAEGARGEAVRWLRRLLAAHNGRTPADSDVYDAALAAEVRDFQRERRLAVDGIAGEQTLVHLESTYRTPGTPRLSLPQEG